MSPLNPLPSLMADPQSPFLRVPSEIRLMIYDLLFDDNGMKTLEIRNVSPNLYNHRPHRRSGYRIVGRGLVRQSQPTTYHLTSDVNIHTSILAVNRQIYKEASHELYGSYTFEFGKDIEAIVPFFSDLTCQTRPLIQAISLIKQGSVYSRTYDMCEWRNVCEYIRENMKLKSLRLVVEAGKPSLGWGGLPAYSAADFKTLSIVKYEPLQWVWELLSIKGIRDLDIVSKIQHCPPSHSQAMAFFAAFSASIETDFADFLRAEMIKD